MKVARIAVNYPLKNNGLLYHYEGELQRGQVVQVPLGKRKEFGCVISLDESQSKDYLETPKEKIKSILSIVADSKLQETELQLFEWMASYYHYSLGQVIFDCLPNELKRPRALDKTLGEGKDLEFVPNTRQKYITEEIRKGLSGFNRYLIHGVTGSGKTAVYMDLIKKTLETGKSVLFLLPEINLTPQFTATFSRYLNA